MNIHLKTLFEIVLLLVVFSPPVGAQVPNHHLYYQYDNRAPLTMLDIVFLGAGSIREDTSRAGLAVTSARLLNDYSKKHGYTAKLDALGTEFDVDPYFGYQVISISALSTNFSRSVIIVKDMMRRMSAADLDLDEAKRKLQETYENAADRGDRGLLRNYALARAVGVDRWYSREAVKRITEEDVRRYCERFLNAEVVFFKAISDLDSTAIEKALLPITENRQRGGFFWSPPTPKKDRIPRHSAFVFERYSHLKNVYCYWLIPIGTVGEDNYVPNMVSWTLGRGTIRGLLYENLREELGLVYGTSCSFRNEDDVRVLEISADPRLENSEKLLTSVQEMIVGLADRPDFWTSIAQLRENPDAIEAHLHGEYTPRRKLNRAVDRAIFNYPSRADGIKSVTDAEIRSFLEKYFVTENLVMMLFGPKDHIIEILEKHWPDITIHVQPVEKAIE